MFTSIERLGEVNFTLLRLGARGLVGPRKPKGFSLLCNSTAVWSLACRMAPRRPGITRNRFAPEVSSFDDAHAFPVLRNSPKLVPRLILHYFLARSLPNTEISNAGNLLTGAKYLFENQNRIFFYFLGIVSPLRYFWRLHSFSNWLSPWLNALGRNAVKRFIRWKN